MVHLNEDEKQWLRSYREILDARFPGVVNDIVLFGSKARGDDHDDSDLDILVIISEGDWKLKRELRDPGYELSFGTDAVPSIQVYTQAEWDRLKMEGSIFQGKVEHEGVSYR